MIAMILKKLHSVAVVCALSAAATAGGVVNAPPPTPNPSSATGGPRDLGPLAGNDGVGGIERTMYERANQSDQTDGTAPKSGLPLAPQETWQDLGMALEGSVGEPRLEGDGKAVPGNTVLLRIEKAKASAPLVMIVGFDKAMTPFKGGTLVPSNDLMIGGLSTNDGGILEMPLSIPLDMPAGAQMYLQTWIVDSAGPLGMSASNGLKMTATN